MQNNNNFDTNISNYNREELLEIIGLPNEDNKNKIKNKIDKLINRSSNEKQLVEFFINIKNFLLNDKSKNYNLHNNDLQNNDLRNNDLQNDNWFSNKYNNEEENNDRNNTNRKNSVNVFKDSPHPVMQRQQLSVTNSVPLQIGQDTLNPNLRQIINRTIMIDSRYRQIILPFSDNPNHISSPTNFTCNLSIPLKNVLKMRLTSLYIPRSFNVYDKYLQNTIFWIKGIDQDDESYNQILIDDGNYTVNDLVLEINKKLSSKSFNDISINIVDTVNKDKLYFQSDTSYTILFYDNNRNINDYISTNENTFKNDCKNIKSKMYYTTSLGYYLGFRHLSNSDNMPEKWSIDILPNRVENASVCVNILGSQYLKIGIEDFNNNQSTSSLITIKRNNDRLSLPSYISKILPDDPNDPNDPNDPVCFMVEEPSSNRVNQQFIRTRNTNLTQNQVYAINNIIVDRNEPDYRITSFNNQHILATIHLSDLTEKIINFNSNDDSLYERKYFGPVLIDRLKISLYDEYGNLVNLNGQDWSLTLSVDELYQY